MNDAQLFLMEIIKCFEDKFYVSNKEFENISS